MLGLIYRMLHVSKSERCCTVPRPKNLGRRFRCVTDTLEHNWPCSRGVVYFWHGGHNTS